MQATFRTTLIALAVSALTFNVQAAAYNTNLIVNGDAEPGIVGWTAIDTSTPLFQVVDYGDNWVKPSEPGPADRGAKMFAGESGYGYSAGFQTLDLSANAAAISTGLVSYNLTGWLGGWTSQNDNAMFMVSFLGSNGNELGSVKLGPVLPADRNNLTSLVYSAASGYLPTATTQVQFLLDMERFSGGDNDGYADNLSFVMAPVPEADTYAMLLAGLGLIGFFARRNSAAR